MHADEHRVRVNKVEFDIPAITLDYVNLDRRRLMMRRGCVILTLAALQHIADFLGSYQPSQKQVLRVYVRTCLGWYVPFSRAAITFRFASFRKKSTFTLGARRS
ncbi:hypothetical protein I6F11_20405 [Ensifer sp. NBAIM29]|nr:hypothetical protein [Ensifer sp. NBAIM29]